MDNKPVTHSLTLPTSGIRGGDGGGGPDHSRPPCLPISARSFWNRNRSRETRGGRGEAGRSASKTRHSFPTPSSQPTLSETRRRSSPSAGRPLASIYASANANRPRLSLCTPSVLPSLVRPRPSSRLPSSIHGIARVGLRRLRI